MSSLNEAYLPPLKNLNGVKKGMGNKGKNFYASLFADCLQQLFTGGINQENYSVNKLKLSKNDYYDYKLQIWSQSYKISDSFLKIFVHKLHKRGLSCIKIAPFPIVEGPSYYCKISDGYDDKIIVIIPHKRPLLDYSEYQ